MPSSPSPSPSPPPSPGRRPPTAVARTVPWLVLVVTVVAGLILWHRGANEARQRTRDLLARRADEIVGRIEERILADAQVLLGGLGLFQANGDVSPETWRRYVGALRMDGREGGILGVGFARWVPAETLAAHLRAQRAAGDPRYTLRPPGERPGYAPVVMMEPATPGNRRILGFDLSSEPTRRVAMEEARDRGVPVMSAPVALVQEQERPSGVLLFVPVYAGALVPEGLEARRAALQGWLYSPIRVADLVGLTLGSTPELSLTIADVGTGVHLHGAEAPPTGRAAAADELALLRELPVLGRRWVIALAAGPGFARQVAPERSGVVLALAVGALLTLAAFALQRRAETAALAEEAARRRILFEASPDGIVLLDPRTGAIVEFNTAAHRQLGYSRDEFARLTVFDVEAAEAPEQTRRRIAEVLAGARADLLTVQRAKDGTLRDVHVTAQWVDVRGEGVYQCIWRDVTERRRVEEALREADRKLRLIGENLPGGYVYQLVAQPDGVFRFTYVSAGVEQVHGVTREQVLRDPGVLYDLVAEEDRGHIAELEQRALAGLTPLSMEFRSRGRNGRALWLRVNSAPTRLPDGSTRFDGVALDVTARRSAEADRLVMSKLESTGILAGGIAHDFNNLLTTVLLGVELAREEARTDSGRAALDDVVEAVAAAQGLTRQLVTFARGGTPVLALVDVERVVRDAARLALTGSPVASRIAVAPGLWAAELDAGQIGQAVRNLVLNAREAMPAGGVVSLELRNVSLGPDAAPDRAPGDYVELTVTDQGGGIPLEVLPRIFDPYFSTKERGAEKGMGLGLTICHSVVKRHGGAISVESTAGRGATFRVLLPARPGAVPALEAPRPGTAPRRGKVLVMDDEEPLRRMLATTLQQLGCTVVEAASGEETVERWGQARAAAAPFDLLLLDLTVRDGMGGLEAMRLLREIDPDTPAVLMSGFSESDALLDPGRHGFTGALRKPFDLPALRATLERSLPAAPAPRPAEPAAPAARPRVDCCT